MGFKLVVLKLESSDPPEKVLAFHHKALSKYGRVLSCSDSPGSTSAQEKANSLNGLDCQNDKPALGETILKTGTKAEQHIVGVKPDGGRTVFQMAYVLTPESGAKK